MKEAKLEELRSKIGVRKSVFGQVLVDKNNEFRRTISNNGFNTSKYLKRDSSSL